MKKRNIVISTMLSMVMFTLSTASAAEGAAEYIKSDSFANAVDVATNTLNELGDDISGAVGEIFQAEPQEPIDKAAAARTKTEWDMEDVISMYEEGYAVEDIGRAIELAPELGTTPYTLLEKKGKPSYEAHELTAEEASLAKQARIPRNAAELATQQVVDAQAVLTPEEVLTADAELQNANTSIQNQPVQMAEEQVQYAMEKVGGKSWETVIAEVQGDTAAADPDMQTIKENGFLEFIDESVFTEDELEYLNGTDEPGINMMAARSASDLVIDTYNNYIFPTSQYSSYNAGRTQSSVEEIEVNPLSRNATVRATDLTLPGKNGLDLTLTRVNSGMNTGTIRPVVKRTQADTTTFSSYFYSVTGYARVTVEYNEPLPNGQYSETFDSEEIMFRPYEKKWGYRPNMKLQAGRHCLRTGHVLQREGCRRVCLPTNRRRTKHAWKQWRANIM